MEPRDFLVEYQLLERLFEFSTILFCIILKNFQISTSRFSRLHKLYFPILIQTVRFQDFSVKRWTCACTQKSRRIEKTRRLGVRYRSWIMADAQQRRQQWSWKSSMAATDRGGGGGGGGPGGMLRERLPGNVRPPLNRAASPPSPASPFAALSSRSIQPTAVLYALGIPRFPFRGFSALNPTSTIPDCRRTLVFHHYC